MAAVQKLLHELQLKLTHASSVALPPRLNVPAIQVLSSLALFKIFNYSPSP